MLKIIMRMFFKIKSIFSKILKMVTGQATGPGSRWWMENANQCHTGFNSSGINVPLEVAWQTTPPAEDPPPGPAIPNRYITFPVFGRDKVVVSRGLPGTLSAISTRDGSIPWSYQVITESGEKATLLGTPVVANRTIYGIFVSYPAGGPQKIYICALREDNGNLQRRKLLTEAAQPFPINMYNGRLCMQSPYGKVYVIDQNTFDTKWTDSTYNSANVCPVFTPLLFANTVVFTGASGIRAYDIFSGVRRWVYDFDAPLVAGSMLFSRVLISTANQIPVVIVVGVVRNDGPTPHNDTLKIYCVGAEDGQERWKYSANVSYTNNECNAVALYSYYSSTYYSNILVTASDQILCLDIMTGLLDWSHQVPARISAPTAISNGIFYYLAENSVLYAMRVRDHRELWNATLPGSYQIYNGYGIAVDQGLVVVSHGEGMVTAFKAQELHISPGPIPPPPPHP